jgi:hypothetical protein
MAATAAWRPIGHVLVEAGAISPEDLELALVEQRQSGRRLGEILIDSGRITWLQLANAIAEQANDLEAAADAEVAVENEVEPAPEPEPALEPEPEPAPAPPVVVAVEPPPVVAVSEPPVSNPLLSPPVTEPVPIGSIHSDDAVTRLETVEAMLKERQRAFLELVSVTERLRATVAKLQDELDQRNAEIMKLRNRSASAA